MSYMTISSQENHHFSLCSYFHAHPTTLLLKILGGPIHGPSPHLKFGGGTVPPVHPRSRAPGMPPYSPPVAHGYKFYLTIYQSIYNWHRPQFEGETFPRQVAFK